MSEVVSSRARGLRDLYGLYNDKTGEFEGVSTWIFLQKDSYYHMELWHDNGGNYEHFTLGVEAEHTEH